MLPKPLWEVVMAGEHAVKDPSLFRCRLLYRLATMPRVRANVASTGVSKNIQACPPLPDLDHSNAAGT